MIFFNKNYFCFFSSIIILIIILVRCSNDISIAESEKEQVILCPPCEIEAIQNQINSVKTTWPEYTGGDLLKINLLTDLKYKQPERAYDNSYWNIKPWWRDQGLAPWSTSPNWGNEYIQPNHNFKNCVNDNLRWMCGYSYSLEVPENYSEERSYPLIIFLHGSAALNQESFIFYENIRTDFHKPKNDSYIYAAPIKLEIDWDHNKIRDLIENIKKNINVDENRIYLTGLSMGGRGTFIVSSKLSKTFAAIMPLSPHHQPYSYLPLAKDVKEIPIFMSHGEIDRVSSYDMAKQMGKILLDMNANIMFRTEIGVGHSGWNQIYRNSSLIGWLLSWKRNMD